MMECEKIQNKISQYLDKEMDMDNRMEFERHISECESCRNEVEEIKKVIDICNNIREEDLPEDFSESLHLKLLNLSSVQSRNENKGAISNKFILFNNKYTKICTAIASVFLIAFICRSILFGNLNNRLNSNTYIYPSNINENIDGTVNPTESNMEANKSNNKETGKNQNSNGKSLNKSPSIVRKENTPLPFGSVDIANAITINKDLLNVENKVKTKIITSVEISISVEDPNTEIQKVKDLASNYEAVFSEGTNGSVNSGENSSTGTEVVNKISFKVLRSKYDTFLNSLKEIYGIINVDKINSIYVNKDIENLEKAIADIEKEISDINNGVVPNSTDNIDNLNNQKEIKKKELDKLNMDAEYYSIVITIS